MNFETLKVWLLSKPWQWQARIDEYEQAAHTYDLSMLVRELENIAVTTAALAQFIRSARGIGRSRTPNGKHNAQATAEKVAKAIGRDPARNFLPFIQPKAKEPAAHVDHGPADDSLL